MIRKRPFLFLIYWITFFLGCVLYCYADGNMRLKKLRLTEGVVIDQIPVRTQQLKNNRDVLRPQIRFFVSNTEYIFVDKSTQLETGDRARIAYPPDNPHWAYIYDFKHWIAVGFLVPAFLFAAFLFSIICISGTKYPTQRVILPSNEPL